MLVILSFVSEVEDAVRRSHHAFALGISPNLRMGRLTANT
jgi:hypothetical protein